MGIRKVEQGPTASRVQDNLRQLRKLAGVTLEELSERMAEVGRPVLPSGLSKIEQGDRRVDVDDLMALALALRVNVSRLLLPDAAGDEPVALTSRVQHPAWAVWQWADGMLPLPTLPEDADEPYNTFAEEEEFQRLSRPWELRRVEAHPLTRAAVSVDYGARRVVHYILKGEPTGLAATRLAVERVGRELDIIEEEQQDG